MAGIRCARSPDTLETLLGSCVGIAVWDELAKCGGLAHALLAESKGKSSSPGKFVDTAVVELKRQLLERGASTHRLKAKIAGGAKMFGGPPNLDVGRENCDAAIKHLKEQNIHLVAKHLRGDKGRIVRFCLDDWSLVVETARMVVAVI